jgi:LSD1 subclass zinc finger protein
MAPDATRDGAVPSPKLQFACSSCGAALEFAPGTTSMVCPYCGAQTSIGARQSRKNDYAAYAARPHDDLPGLAPFTVRCANCGATDTTTAISSRCPACDGPIVVTDDLGGRLKSPDGIVPFVVDRDRAGKEFREWVGSRWFAPSGLKKVVRADSMRGAHLPYWTFDDKTRTDYTGRRGEYYYTTETYTTTDANGNTQTQTRQVRHTRWYPASGQVSRDFVDLTVAAVQWPDPEVLRKLGPWSTADATGYEPQFLSGFDTPRYTVPAEAGFAVARREMAQQIEQDCRHDIGGDEQQVLSMQTTDSDVLFRLLLMPVWLATYRYSGKDYHVHVNANTGEVIGERPYSAAKIAFLVLVIAAVVAGIVVLVQTSQH